MPEDPSCQQQRLTAFGWLLRLSRSLSQFETQDIKTQPQFNHYIQGAESVREPAAGLLLRAAEDLQAWIPVTRLR